MKRTFLAVRRIHFINYFWIWLLYFVNEHYF